MKLVQFETSEGRRLGAVVQDRVHDLTAVEARCNRVVHAFEMAQSSSQSLAQLVDSLLRSSPRTYDYQALLANRDLKRGPVLRPPVDHIDPHRVLVTGTGLTHLGSMQSRDEMHSAPAAEVPLTDSKKMFQMGLAGGRPAPGERGVSPEWFYKGNGTVLRGPNDALAIPPFADDGGEEPEIVGCYIIDHAGNPRRLGFALGNEWSDHATESINYLYLAPSKLRQCSIGPELILDCPFDHVELRCTVRRRGETIYDSGQLLSGEQHMCHSLANCEDHHFKYPEHRVPGDVHIHFFGTSKLSFRERDWKYQDGDEVRVEAPALSPPLVNFVSRAPQVDTTPIRVRSA